MDLHITNGDGAANIIKACAVPGDVLPWRDPMHHGPFPAGLTLDELAQVRGEYLEGPLADKLDEDADPARGFRLRDDHLRASSSYDGVVLWFEHDLLDQLQILQLLDWFAQTDLGNTSLEMICIDRFDGIDPFRGIGELNAEQMASLVEFRKVVTPAELELAQEGWRRFRDSDPRVLQEFLSRDLSALPFLEAALKRHLQEYPSSQSGITRSERQLLELVADGVQGPGELFIKNMELETVYFIGDWPTYRHIDELCHGSHPLLESTTGQAYWHPSMDPEAREKFRNQRLRLTDLGREVLACDRDVFGLFERNHWLGGVHVQSSGPMWTWNESAGTLQLRES